MKKTMTLILALVLALSFAVCAQAEETEEESWYTLSEDGILTVTLDANATTGYQWLWDCTDLNVLDMLDCSYTSSGSGLTTGAGGIFEASFANLSGGIGEATLVLSYVRLWEMNDPADCLSVTVNCGEDGSMTVLQAGSVSDRRDYYNLHRFDLLNVTNVYAENETVFVEGSFGTVDFSQGEDNIEMIGFEEPRTFRFELTDACGIMMPEDEVNLSKEPIAVQPMDLVEWYGKVNALIGNPEYKSTFYASFDMNEAGKLTALKYFYLP